MKEILAKSAEKVFITTIPPIKFGEDQDNAFIKACNLMFNSQGNNYTYEYLMGICGAAFKLHFDPHWCPSSVDPTTGYDVSNDLLRATGYKGEMHRIDHNNPDDINDLFSRIKIQIDRGIPIPALNINLDMEWGLIIGYSKKEPAILCHSYSENNTYILAERAPWVTLFLGEHHQIPAKDELFHNSLRIASNITRTEQYDGYKSGLKAFEAWIAKLTELVETKTRFMDFEANLVILNSLLDSRNAAVRYLLSFNYKMLNGNDLINNYREEVLLLKDMLVNILPDYNSKEKAWTKAVLNKQIEILNIIYYLEKENIELIEEEIESYQEL